MSKVFEYLLMQPIQSVFVLVIGVSITYTIIRILKGIFGLFTRKRKIRKELEKQERQAELVVDKLGGVETFCECVAEKVINKQKVYIDKLKQEIEEIQAMDRCPIELKAYIETVLKANPTLLLQYEELKVKYKGNSVRKDIPKAKGKQEHTQEKREEETTIQAEIKEEQKEEISYV